MTLETITLRLSKRLRELRFAPPVASVYNPLEYAWSVHVEYLRRYGGGKREVVLVGMNPGPWGMVQTGVPFGDVTMVRDWLGLTGRVVAPPVIHPKRPVHGFSCRRREISGHRLWGWARATFATPERFFRRFFVVNYCPLCFFEAGGANRTPDRLAAGEREKLYEVCDSALLDMMHCLQPRLVVGIGRFAECRAREALIGTSIPIAHILHPSGANPRASRDWAGQVNSTLASIGITL